MWDLVYKIWGMWDLVPPDFNDNIALFYSSSDLHIQPEDGLTGRGRNMQLAETFVHTLTPCILHKYSCVLTAILYEFVYLVLRYTTRMALLKIGTQTWFFFTFHWTYNIQRFLQATHFNGILFCITIPHLTQLWFLLGSQAMLYFGLWKHKVCNEISKHN